MSTITRRFTITAHREIRQEMATVSLGRAVEWDGENIVVDLDALPCGNWWGGVATLVDEGDRPTAGEPTITRQFDLVAGKRSTAPEGKTRWIKVGVAIELAGSIRLDFAVSPAGTWWDGKLRLFLQKPDAKPRKPSRAEHC